ncbi:MAG: hypothetical protein ACOVOS_03910, partial [Chitinophagaceae bacterium]
SPVLATAYSLFIVGATSLVGSFPKYKAGEINLKTALIFGIPSIVAVLPPGHSLYLPSHMIFLRSDH